jgi:hypothetical protein
MTLLRQIQDDLASADSDVLSVLRKCKILAARLNSPELTHWADYELDGFPDAQPLPEYRKLGITYYASFMNLAWRRPKEPVPIQLVPEEHRDSFRFVEFREGIAKAVIFAQKETGARIERPELVPAFEGIMWPQMNCQSVWGEIPIIEFEQLLSAVKNRILDFSLKIEAENPSAGEALPNSQPVPKDKLQPLVQNIFYGAVGNFAQNSDHFSQTASRSFQQEDLSRLVKELTQHLDELGLDEREKQRANAQIATLRAELAGEPDPIIVKQAGHTLRNITEGAIGSLLATAAQPTVWLWVHQMLQTLSNLSPK